MKFSVSSKALHGLCANIAKVINVRNAVAVLNNFLVTLEDGTLIVSASDIDSCLSGRIPVLDVEGEGSFLIDARRLVSLLKEIGEQPLTFILNEDTYEAELFSQSGHFSMAALKSEQYPSYKHEANDEKKSFLCNAEMLIKGIECTLFAVGTDSLHPQLTGLLIDVHNEDVTFVGTDTRKLVKYVNSSIQPGIEASCIVSAKTAGIIKSTFAKTDVLTVELLPEYGSVTSDSYTFTFNFIKGRFPDYNRVIPKDNPYLLSLNRKVFINAVRRISVFVDPGFGLAKAKVNECGLQLKSSDPNLLTQGTESVDCTYQGEEMVIGVSAPYLIEILNALASENIVCRIADPSRPLVFEPATALDKEELTIILMPMSVQDF